MADILEHLPYFSTENVELFDLDDILSSYRHKGFGLFSCYSAFQFTKNKEILPIKNFDSMSFSDLKNYEYQKGVIKQNTKAFLEDKEPNNILLYGDRGCGKSSTVKALLNEFQESNLKIIQVYKESFIYLSDLFEQLRNQPAKFIIFADDISFDENDKEFSSIKAILEGSLSNRPSNTIIYATTNRMHLVKETFSSREGNEIHYNDTIDEMVSLSDRFGIMLTFSLLTKSEYLDIVEQIAIDCCVEVSDTLYKEAEAFSALKSIRTPRVARQFIIDFIAKHEL
jgi:predicted AAA+ superfamily ATPase